jgi:glycine/D-amino acid oxidase-like deaminating enzyme
MLPNASFLSYWERESFLSGIDVAIIGSGIVGLNAAITLKEQQPDLKVVVLERGFLPYGASTRNAGFACFGSLTELIDDLKTHSEDEVFALVERRWRGLERLRERVGDAALDYKPWGGYEIFRENERHIADDCAAQMAYFNTQLERIVHQKAVYQLQNERIAKQGFVGIQTLIANTAEGQIDTGKMMNALLLLAQQKGVIVYNGLKINAIHDFENGTELETDLGFSIKAAKILVCTNGFAKRLFPTLEVEPARNQVLITAPISDLKIQGCYHYDCGYYYFRNINNRILLGGGRNINKNGEATDAFGLTDEIQMALEHLLHDVILPHQKIDIELRWSGILGIGAQKKPIVEYIGHNVAVAVRMGGMGVAIGSLVGEEGANLIIGKQNS